MTTSTGDGALTVTGRLAGRFGCGTKAAGKKWENFLEQKLNSGNYQSVNEMVQDGLRRLEPRDLDRIFGDPPGKADPQQ